MNSQKYVFTVHNDKKKGEVIEVASWYVGLPVEYKNLFKQDRPDWAYAVYLTIREEHPLFDKDVDFWHNYCHCGCTYFETKEVTTTNTWGSSYKDEHLEETKYKVRVIGMDFSHYGDNIHHHPCNGIPTEVVNAINELKVAL